MFQGSNIIKDFVSNYPIGISSNEFNPINDFFFILYETNKVKLYTTIKSNTQPPWICAHIVHTTNKSLSTVFFLIMWITSHNWIFSISYPMALGQPLTISYYYRYCKQWKCETNKLAKHYKSVISFEQNYQVKAVLN